MPFFSFTSLRRLFFFFFFCIQCACFLSFLFSFLVSLCASSIIGFSFSSEKTGSVFFFFNYFLHVATLLNTLLCPLQSNTDWTHSGKRVGIRPFCMPTKSKKKKKKMPSPFLLVWAMRRPCNCFLFLETSFSTNFWVKLSLSFFFSCVFFLLRFAFFLCCLPFHVTYVSTLSFRCLFFLYVCEGVRFCEYCCGGFFLNALRFPMPAWPVAFIKEIC